MHQTCLTLTLDVDSDANVAVPGQIGSVFAGSGDRPHYEAAEWGTRRCLDICTERALPSVWFLEALTAGELGRRGIDWSAFSGRAWCEIGCHGHAHEDFSGHVSGIVLDRNHAARVIADSTTLIEELTGLRPRAFRAPYNRLTDALASALVEADYAYDSSLHLRLSAAQQPFQPGIHRTGEGETIREVWLPKLRDPRGKVMSCYLWQLMEGNRPPDDYVHFVRRACEVAPGGLVQLALHPWHLAVSAAGEPFDDRERKQRLDALREVLDRIAEVPDLRPITFSAWLAERS